MSFIISSPVAAWNVRRRLLHAFAACSLFTCYSCARLPPSVSGFTGRRIRVTMTFYGAMQSNLFYYFLINRYGPTGDQNAHGPIPVLGVSPQLNNSLGNGYATGSGPNNNGTITNVPDYGITDFVLYGPGVTAQNRIGLYHYTDDPNKQQFPSTAPSNLINVVLPESSETSTTAAKTLQFDLYISQLISDTNDQAQRNQEAQKIRWLQVNIVATNTISMNPEASTLKQVDAFGDTLHPSNSQFLTIDLTQSRTYSDSNSLSNLPEPQNDVYPVGNGDISLDLQSWSIQVIPN